MKNSTVINRTLHCKIRNAKAALFALLTCMCLLLVTACRQESGSPAPDATARVDVAKVKALEELGHKFGFTETDYQHYEHGIHELNAEELELFNDLEMKRFLGSPNLREGDKENIMRMRELKKELNRRTLKAYNKPYNQVEGAKVVKIVEVLDQRSKATGGRQAATCPYVRKFPTSAPVGAIAKVYCGNLANVQKEDDPDCDYQYSFFMAYHNGYHYVIGLTPKARQLLTNSLIPPLGECSGFGGSVSRRRSEDVLNASGTDYIGGSYCLLLGKDRVDWCFGSGGNLYDKIAMGF